MAKKILTNASVVVNGVTLSDHSNKVTITSSKNLVDVTSFGAAAKQNLVGLGDGTIAVDLFQDFDAGSVDATLWPIHQAGTAVVIVIKPDAGAIGTTNPSYTMTGVLPQYTPLDGSVGDASKVSVTFQNADQSGIVRATS